MTELYVIKARSAPLAVIFRRGPSKRVQLISWNTETDEFSYGQWLKGRIYAEQCDLSPSGRYLVYAAENFRKPYGSWTAISRPPYLTALALWPGSGLDGGGLFETEQRVILSLFDNQISIADGFKLPSGFKVDREFLPGVDLMARRLARDGWKEEPIKNGALESESTQPDPRLYWKTTGKGQFFNTLKMHIEFPYRVEFSLLDRDGHMLLDLSDADWADLDRNNNLIYAASGKLMRVRLEKGFTKKHTELIDLSGQEFYELGTPEQLRRW